MKFKYASPLLVILISFTTIVVEAKDLKFPYPCKAYHYVGKPDVDQHEELIDHPLAASYTFVKTASKKGTSKWKNSYSIEIALKAGGGISLPLVDSQSGDEGYQEYHIPEKGPYVALINTFWISSGHIRNDESGASFEGNVGDENIFFDCEK